MSHHREILSALQKLKSGEGKLTTEQYVGVLEAIEQAAQALHTAPRGSDPVATGVWWNHERTPAMARLADALAAHEPVGREPEPKHGRAVTQASAPTKDEAPEAEAATPEPTLLKTPAAKGKLRKADGSDPTDAEIARALYNALLEHTEH